ncbi:MAG: UrcA family protein [Novosphingobium sp.]|nr:UrcA family protein [Novosphingobium sp.]
MSKYLFFASVLAATLTASANAQEQSVTVSYGDLNLASEEGVERFDHRIRAAVRAVCGNPHEHRDLRANLAVGTCKRGAWSEIEAPRQYAIDRALGKQPSVRFAGVGEPTQTAILVRKR